MKDRKRQDMQDIDQPLYQELTETILGCCFDVMNDFGVGLLVNFRKRRLEYKRVHHPDHHAACDPADLVFL